MSIPRGRKRLIVVTSFVLMAVLFFVALVAYRQATSGPRYKGRSVERWLATFSNDPDPEVINAFGISACPELIRVLQKEKTAFAGVWVRLPQGLRQKLRHLDPSTLPEHQRLAARWLNALGTDAEAVVPQLAAVASAKPEFASTLAFVGKNTPEAPEVLATLLQHTNIMVREDVALAPGVLGSNALPLLAALTNFLVNHPRHAPFNAILGIGLIGPSASNAVPLLIGVLGNSNLVGNTLTALESIGPGAVAAVPPICELLKNSTLDKQLSLVECLYAMGKGASQALPHLRKLQSAETNLLQLLISLTLAQIEDDREQAAVALARSLAGRKIRTDDQTFTIVLPDSRTTLGSYVGLRHAQYAALLAADYPDHPELLPHLRNALDSSDKWLQIMAEGNRSTHAINGWDNAHH